MWCTWERLMQVYQFGKCLCSERWKTTYRQCSHFWNIPCFSKWKHTHVASVSQSVQRWELSGYFLVLSFIEGLLWHIHYTKGYLCINSFNLKIPWWGRHYFHLFRRSRGFVPLISRVAILYYFKCPSFKKADETYKKPWKYIT